MSARPRIVTWFSCGDASAVTAKLVLQRYSQTYDVRVARCVLADEHPDNDRFAFDCEQWLGAPIYNLCSLDYETCHEVFADRRYMSGTRGAPCTQLLKKDVRKLFEIEWRPDLQAFGYTAEEKKRAARFREQNPTVNLVTPLIDEDLKKDDCHAIIAKAGIELPAMYRLGFQNNNCIGCVKSDSATYWNRVRQHFPAVFADRAAQSRGIGCRLLKHSTGKRERYFLDELDPADVLTPEPKIDCSLMCERLAEELQ